MQNLERMRELIQTIKEADEAYYKYDAPIMADLDYDPIFSGPARNISSSKYASPLSI